jgi:hypothetical protein
VTLTAVDYFEDVVIGQVYATPGLTLTEAHRTQFLGLGGDRPEPAADAGRIPDLLPLCLSSGLGFRAGPPLAVLAFMGFEWEFRQPLYVGDTMRSRSSTVAKRSLREGGVVVEAREILNQRGEVMQGGRLTLLVAKRPAERA